MTLLTGCIQNEPHRPLYAYAHDTIIAITALLLAFASLVWQFITWRRSGHKVTAEFCRFVLRPPGGPVRDEAGVLIRNEGRGPVQVRSIDFDPPAEDDYMIIDWPGAQSRFPFVLQGLSSEVVVLDKEQLARAVAGDLDVGTVTAKVWLGNGRWVKAEGGFNFRAIEPVQPPTRAS